MNIQNFIIIVIALLSGAVVAFVYLKLLWITVRHLHESAHRKLLLTVSFLARMLLLGAVFYLFLRQGGWYAVMFFTGFWIIRQLIMRRTVNEDKTGSWHQAASS